MNRAHFTALQKGNVAAFNRGVHWRARMSQTAAARERETRARIERALAAFREVPDEDLDPNFRPITADDLLRRRG
jgi:hypothetical protein